MVGGAPVVVVVLPGDPVVVVEVVVVEVVVVVPDGHRHGVEGAAVVDVGAPVVVVEVVVVVGDELQVLIVRTHTFCAALHVHLHNPLHDGLAVVVVVVPT